MKVDIRTRVNQYTWKFTIVVIVDGAIREMLKADTWNVTDRRNRLCAAYSHSADTVIANAIPDILNRRRTPERRKLKCQDPTE